MSQVKPLILHTNDAGATTIKIAVALEMMQIPYQVKFWNIGNSPQKTADNITFVTTNESSRLPVLDDPNTGVLSWESGACINYIRRVYDGANIMLGPSATTEQEKVDFDKWEYFLLSTLEPMTRLLVWFRHTKNLLNEDALSLFESTTYQCYAMLEAQVAKTGAITIMLGKFTAVDVHFIPIIRQHELAGLSLDKYPNVKKWLDNMKTLIEVQSAYATVKKAKGAFAASKLAIDDLEADDQV